MKYNLAIVRAYFHVRMYEIHTSSWKLKLFFFEYLKTVGSWWLCISYMSEKFTEKKKFQEGETDLNNYC